MSINTRTAWRLGGILGAVAAAVALVSATTMAQGRGNPNPGVTPPNRQYPDLSAQWWQWALAQPVSQNPLFDQTGADAARGQPRAGNIFFLAGLISLNSGLEASVERTITIPTGTRLFFPVLNSEADYPTTATGATTVEGLRAEAAFFAAQIQSLVVTIDGKPLTDLTAYRTISPVFEYTLPDEDNLLQFFGLDVAGTVTPVVGDGYYVLLKPLQKGPHTIVFGGTTNTIDSDGNPALFSLRITYHITVQPGGKP